MLEASYGRAWLRNGTADSELPLFVSGSELARVWPIALAALAVAQLRRGRRYFGAARRALDLLYLQDDGGGIETGFSPARLERHDGNRLRGRDASPGPWSGSS